MSTDVSNLKPGDRDYRAYVGPPEQYDFMGATQFRLHTTLGLRGHHKFLDFGCGSLRAGRLFISYLEPGHYFGIEPNQWLLDEAIQNQIGQDLVRIKQPHFDHNSDFATDVFGVKFDFINAQSIFTHCGVDLIHKGLGNFAKSLRPDGIVAASFFEGKEKDDFTGNGWIYPGCVRYCEATIKRFGAEAGLHAIRIPWFNPRAGWYLFAKDKNRVPTRPMLRHLTGAVLHDPEFAASWKSHHPATRFARKYAGQTLPLPVKKFVKKLMGEPQARKG